jgi:flavodoxin
MDMKSLVIYSSQTGNTKKIAEAIFESLPEPKAIHAVEEKPSPDEFDFIAMGFWVDRGTADAKAQLYMKTLKGKKIGIFGTLGAYPDSDHARKCLDKVMKMLKGNEIIGSFLIQGKIDPASIEEARKHPNKQDCLNAKNAFEAMLRKLSKGNQKRL